MFSLRFFQNLFRAISEHIGYHLYKSNFINVSTTYMYSYAKRNGVNTVKRENRGSIAIIYVEPGDEMQSVQDALNFQQGSSGGIVIVLPGQPTRAFQSPRDFNDLKRRKRREDLPIVFVISNDSLAQWAKMNGFSV